MTGERAHFFDARTCYCTQCGIGVDRAIGEQVLFCQASEKVVAISHIVRGQMLRKIERDLSA